MLTIGTISGLLTKFHGEIKKNTKFMAQIVFVEDTRLIFAYNKVSLWKKFGRCS